MHMKVKDSARRLAVVKKVEFVALEVVHRKTMRIRGMERETDLINRNPEPDAPLVGHICGVPLRICPASMGKHGKNKQGADGPSRWHIEVLSER